ncbi:hypothetical protein V8E36_005760 [Tilletia maclaganii]
MSSHTFLAPSQLGQEPSPEALAALLLHLLECPASQLPTLTAQSIEAIKELPADARPRSYEGLLDVARFIIEDEPGWSIEERAAFVGGHPRIGAPLAPTANTEISDASRAEQLKGGDTTPETLARLERLNKLYELRFPLLRFVTFVAGRPRAAIADEIEGILGAAIVGDASIDPDKPETFPKAEVKDLESEEWQDELVRAEDALWRIAADRASKLPSSGNTAAGVTSPPLSPDAGADTAPFPPPKASAPTPSSTATPASATATASQPQSQLQPATAPAAAAGTATGAEEPFLSLASFRMLVLSSPVLESFFERDLSTSFILEPPERSASGGAFAWHAAPMRAGAPRAVPGDRKTSLSSASATAGVGGSAAAGGGGSVDSSYSKDITTGAKGRVVGFLGGLLGEEGKAKMTQLADTVAQRLQTHTVTGPKPSFGRTGGGVTLDGRRMDMGEMEEDERRRKEERVREMAAERKRGLAGRLAGAFQSAVTAASGPPTAVAPSGSSGAELDQRGRPGAPAPVASAGGIEEEEEDGRTSKQSKRQSLRGVDLSYAGPDGAAATLRQATAALLDDRSHFVIDEPGLAGGAGDISGSTSGLGGGEGGGTEFLEDEDEDELDDAAGLRKTKSGLSLRGVSSSGELAGLGEATGGKLEGQAAQLAKDLRSAKPQ